MAVVNLAEEIVGGVLQHAELLRGAVVAADSGAVESLRWSGALSLLMRDLGVPRLLALPALWRACEGGALSLATLLTPPQAWHPEPDAEQDGEISGVTVEHLVVILSGFLWEYEPRLVRLVELGVVRRLTICSSLSERAHECFDFGSAPARKMELDTFATVIAVRNGFKRREVVTDARTAMAATASSDDNGKDDEWDWTDEDVEVVATNRDTQPNQGATDSVVRTVVEGVVEVVHLPLNYAPLLSSKLPQQCGEPSLFVLSHPMCATAFPLLLRQVVEHHKQQQQLLPAAPTTPGFPEYSHVKEVMPEHIPSGFRRTLKLVAYTLGEMVTQTRLDVKDRIFAMGATSLKIGHTLLRIVNEIEQDITAHILQSHQAATIVLMDRTCDVASPCSFGVSLLDRVIALLPQTPEQVQSVFSSQTNRKGLHVTEIFPLHGCDPSPLSVSQQPEAGTVDKFIPSNFIAGIKWKAGASLCHPHTPHGASVFRSLAFRPAKLALRDLDKRLQEVEQELVQQRKITRTGSSRKPGEKKTSTRGRDVVLRRISNILEAGEPRNSEHSALIELGIIVLETLERMEEVQQRWDSCRERALRQIQLRKKNAGEWIIPELADTVQRQFMTHKTSKAASTSVISFHELLALLVHAYALSAGSPIEDHTLQMIRNVVSDCLLEAMVTNTDTVKMVCPALVQDLLPYIIQQKEARASGLVADGEAAGSSTAETDDAEGDDWEWNENSPKGGKTVSALRTNDDDVYERAGIKAKVESHVDNLLSPLKECAQLYAKQNDQEFASSGEDAPRSLVAQVCQALVCPTMRAQIAELEHVVDASEQLTRAGIDLLKSGFSRFGFGGAGAAGGGRHTIMGESKVLVIFVVGGVTFEEIQEVYTALGDNPEYQIILGGSTMTNSEILLEQIFR